MGLLLNSLGPVTFLQLDFAGGGLLSWSFEGQTSLRKSDTGLPDLASRFSWGYRFSSPLTNLSFRNHSIQDKLTCIAWDTYCLQDFTLKLRHISWPEDRKTPWEMGLKILHLKCNNPVSRRRKQQTYFQLYEKIFFHFGLFLSIQILEPVYCFLLVIEAASTGLCS